MVTEKIHLLWMKSRADYPFFLFYKTYSRWILYNKLISKKFIQLLDRTDFVK